MTSDDRKMSPPPDVVPKRRRLIRKWLIVVIFLYVIVVILMCMLENSLVYRPDTAADHWEDPPDPAIEEVIFPSSDGTLIHAWHLPCPGSSETLLLCHGNGGNISYRGGSLIRFRQHLGCATLVFDYPGYGKSAGSPNEERCYAAAEGALTWLSESKDTPSQRVILYGESLGGGVAVEMAIRHKHRALVLAKTFTDLPSVAQRLYRWLPVKLLMHNRFDNLRKMPEVKGPIFITSATHDELIPYAHGVKLFEAAHEPKQFFKLDGQDHGDRLPDEFMIALLEFLDKHR
jgi:uncharacterized protein